MHSDGVAVVGHRVGVRLLEPLASLDIAHHQVEMVNPARLHRSMLLLPRARRTPLLAAGISGALGVWPVDPRAGDFGMLVAPGISIDRRRFESARGVRTAFGGRLLLLVLL